MRYLGGKTRAAKRIAEIMASRNPHTSVYWEPFLGGGSVAAAVADTGMADRMMLSDCHYDLTLMWKGLLDGWVPPQVCTREHYELLRNSDHSQERGWIGFAASYNGKWFGGYGPKAESAGRDYLAESARLVAKKVESITSSRFQMSNLDYREIDPQDGDVVYLDPPYASTEGYGGTSDFDSNELWLRARRWSRSGVRVFVSEYVAPSDFVSLLDIDRAATLAHQATARRNVEGLFVKPKKIRIPNRRGI